ncbi:ABC transporter substrate-binding protein [Aestuariispira ectoiniformans]|uniref:ABC transporter substrate-binding protein n=1 Tax=Aestuariispira ectoiniformans TaxID=2775080 RepID=UPI00223AEDC7|nr:ABC transporter substrate-binding protein [Aestuariispira ectoiniformans]
MKVTKFLKSAVALAVGGMVATGAAQAADKVTVASLTFVSSSPLFIAYENGYFKDQDIDVEFKFFNAAQPVAVAVTAGDADFGVTAFTGGFFNLAGKGALKVVASQFFEKKGYDGSAILASNDAFAKGFDAPEKFPNHSYAMSQVGSSFHFMLGQVAQKAGFTLKDVSLKPLQKVPNMIAALKTNQVDSMIIVPHIAKPLAGAGAANIIGWVADYAEYQGGALFTSTDNAAEKSDVVQRFVKAYQKGVADYSEAFLKRDAEGKPVYGAKTDETLKIVHKYVYKDRPAEKAYVSIKNGALYFDPQARLDVDSIKSQLKWFQDNKLVDAKVSIDDFVDPRFVPSMN